MAVSKRFSPKEIAAFDAAFNLIDLDGDGIDEQELLNFLRDCMPSMPDHEVRKTTKEIFQAGNTDSDFGDQRLDREEFLRILRTSADNKPPPSSKGSRAARLKAQLESHLNSDQMERFMNSFPDLDKNRDGRVDGAEIMSFLRRLFPHQSSDWLLTVQRMIIQAFDSDGGGYLDFSEFNQAKQLTPTLISATRGKPKVISEKIVSEREVGETLIRSERLDSHRIEGSERESDCRLVGQQQVVVNRNEKVIEVPVVTVEEQLVIREKEKELKVPVIKFVEKLVNKPIYKEVRVPVEVRKEVIVRHEVKVPVEKVVERVRTVIVKRIIEKVVEKVVERIVEIPVERIVTEVEEVFVEKTVEKIIEVAVPQLSERIVKIPLEHFVEKIVEVPVEHIIEKIVEVPVERIVERIVEVPVEHIVEQVVEVEVPGMRFNRAQEWHDNEYVR